MQRRVVDEQSRQEKAEVEREARSFSGAHLARGSLVSTPFTEVMSQLYRWRATGALLLRRDKVKKIVYVKEGYPVFIKSNLLVECLGQVMVRERMITQADCELSTLRMREAGRQQGAVLMEMGIISPHNLKYALQLQLETKLFDVFGWTHGDYQFNTKGEIPLSAIQLEHSPAMLILEGVKRTWGMDRLVAAVKPHLHTYPRAHPDPLQRQQELELTPLEAQCCALMDGTRSLLQVLEQSPLSPAASHALCYGLWCAQVFTAHTLPLLQPPAPPALLLPAGPPPLPRASAPPPLPEAAVISGVPPARRGASGAAPLIKEDRERVEALSRRVKEMRRMDCFEMLGISRAAPVEEVRKAYFSQAKDYHPDRHFGSHSAEVKALADQIYSMLSTAYETLADARDREEYLRGIHAGHRSGVSDEVGRILNAQRHFVLGAAHMGQGDWPAAAAAFQEAVRIYPEEGEFHSHLGWALQRASGDLPGVTQKAMSHLEKGLQLNPKCDQGYLFLGLVHKEQGHTNLAALSFERALQANPDCQPALVELKRLRTLGDPALPAASRDPARGPL